jgi:hypothetical protein
VGDIPAFAVIFASLSVGVLMMRLSQFILWRQGVLSVFKMLNSTKVPPATTYIEKKLQALKFFSLKTKLWPKLCPGVVNKTSA